VLACSVATFACKVTIESNIIDLDYDRHVKLRKGTKTWYDMPFALGGLGLSPVKGGFFVTSVNLCKFVICYSWKNCSCLSNQATGALELNRLH